MLITMLPSLIARRWVAYSHNIILSFQFEVGNSVYKVLRICGKRKGLAPCVCCHIFGYVWVAEWPPVGRMAARSAYNRFSWCKYLIINLVFPTSVFGVGSFF